jgi:formylglycine-generating enzyme required for sulfatase activity
MLAYYPRRLWFYNPQFLRAANRSWVAAGTRGNGIGFRLARTLNP